ncbi:sugar transferase [Macrococcus lamae]|uniref:Sugar transferase n=1 Tax=Macrococcus lamae TaxID=198484 RepID=A0A4R6BS78_9STAP|nr:sugar transferase [Macrococcus lamae]TDM05195.1 sugar transferase [Macrococcus lamae]
MDVKRLFDITTSAAGLLVLSPVMVVSSLLIRQNLGSPVIFKQTRPGKDGEPFEIYKFRTMTDEKCTEGNLLPDDVRLTEFGALLRKLSIDELPQLFNVLKGDISIVGPRPLLMFYLDLYDDHQRRRMEIKPGITGWAQVNGRNNISWKEKFDLDVWYVDNQSFLLDLKIIWMTFGQVIRQADVNEEGYATASDYDGTN